MIWFAVFVLLRVGFVALTLLTAAYGIVSYSPFAFDMFIRPQLLPWVNQFVAWHHVWFAIAYAGSVVTLLPELDWRTRRSRTAAIGSGAAVGYVIVFGAVAVWLARSPYLPSLWNDTRSLVAGLVAFVPVLWLAVIDHLSTGTVWTNGRAASAPTGERRLLASCAIAAGYVWAAHLLRARMAVDDGGTVAWLVTGIWALTLTTVLFALVFVVMDVVAAIAAGTAAPAAAEYVATVGLLAFGLGELLRGLVLPAISVGGAVAVLVACVAGGVLALAWSGLALRRRVILDPPPQGAMASLLAPATSPTITAVIFAVLPIVVFVALGRMERFDWNFLVQRLIVAAEAVIAFGCALSLTSRTQRPALRTRARVIVTLLPVAALVGMPRGGAALAAWTGRAALEPSAWTERWAASEVAFKLIANGLVAWPGIDPTYFRSLQISVSPALSITTPTVEFSRGLTPTMARRPDIFLIVVDSLRRDYLSPYNAAVTFTPNIEAFAAASFVFRNAFTRYGGTELAMPSIWVGGAVVRRVVGPGFERANAIEKLLDADDYRIAINDYTVSARLQQTTPVTTIDPGVPSAETDLCQNLTSLEAHLDSTRADPRPVFGYFAPMNVHLVNTRHAGRPTASDRAYPGFYNPYASRLRRIDGCFGEFIAYLKQRNRYDNALIILTSDHGDSLGEDGNWGHAFWLFPEDVRVPLLVHLPARLAGAVTTDVGRVAFSTDIAPTLYALLGHRVRDLGPLFGSPLFVPPDREPVPRRRESFLLTSSYAATFGLLRRNGRSLYISDLFEKKEFAFDLGGELRGRRRVIDHVLRQVNQRLIREQVADVERLYEAVDGDGSPIPPPPPLRPAPPLRP